MSVMNVTLNQNNQPESLFLNIASTYLHVFKESTFKLLDLKDIVSFMRSCKKALELCKTLLNDDNFFLYFKQIVNIRHSYSFDFFPKKSFIFPNNESKSIYQKTIKVEEEINHEPIYWDTTMFTIFFKKNSFTLSCNVTLNKEGFAKLPERCTEQQFLLIGSGDDKRFLIDVDGDLPESETSYRIYFMTPNQDILDGDEFDRTESEESSKKIQRLVDSIVATQPQKKALLQIIPTIVKEYFKLRKIVRPDLQGHGE